MPGAEELVDDVGDEEFQNAFGDAVDGDALDQETVSIEEARERTVEKREEAEAEAEEDVGGRLHEKGNRKNEGITDRLEEEEEAEEEEVRERQTKEEIAAEKAFKDKLLADAITEAAAPEYSEEVKSLFADIPDIEKAFKEYTEINGLMTKAEATALVKDIRDQEKVEEKATAKFQADFFGEAESAEIDDVEDIVNSEEFHEWAKSQPEEIQSMYRAHDTKKAVTVIKLYRLDNPGVVTPPKTTKDPKSNKEIDNIVDLHGHSITPKKTGKKSAAAGDFDDFFDEAVSGGK